MLALATREKRSNRFMCMAVVDGEATKGVLNDDPMWAGVKASPEETNKRRAAAVARRTMITFV